MLCPLAKKRETYLASFLDHDFPLEWMDRDLTTVKGASKKALQTAMSKALLGRSGEDVPWFYVHGSRGCGRTYLLACFANTWVAQGRGNVAFIETTRLMGMLRSAYYGRDKSKFQTLMQTYSTCSLLVLDDFGNEPKDKTGFAYSTILYPLLDARAKAGLCTCFSSDFSMREIGDMYVPTLGAPRARQFQDLLIFLCRKGYLLQGISQW